MWATIATIWGVCLGIGAGVDLLFLGRQERSRIHARVSRVWRHVDGWRLPDIPKEAATRALTWVSPIRSAIVSPRAGEVAAASTIRRVSWVRVGIITAISLLLTLIILVVSHYIDHGSQDLNAAVRWATTKWYWVYAGANLLFDAATVVITLRILHLIATHGRLLVLPLVCIDLAFAAVLVFLANPVTVWAKHQLGLSFKGWLDEMADVFRGLVWLIAPESDWAAEGFLINALSGTTTLIPSLAFLLLLIALMLAMPIARVGHYSAKHVLRVASQRPSEEILVASMTGAFVAMLATLGVVTRELFLALM